MSKAIVTPRELERFADHLDRVAQSVESKRARNTRLVQEAGHVWRDAKYAPFRSSFEQTAAELGTFAKRARDYAAFLRSKAARARRYLDQH